MERIVPSIQMSSTKGVTSQNLTVEQLKNKRKPPNIEVLIGPVKAEGAFSTVYTADLFTRTQEKIVMKVIRTEKKGEFQEINQYNLTEIEIMSQIDNPYINKLIDYYFQEDQDTQQEELVLLQPLAVCDLNQFLEENYPEGKMPQKLVIEFLAQLAIGIKAIHDNKVIHRNINPQNILVFKNDKKTALNDQEYILKITDFGCSRILEPHEYQSMIQGVSKISYMAPEQLNNSEEGYNSSVDIYSLGLTVFKMLTGKVLNAVEQPSKNFKADYYSPEFIDLLYQLCSIDYKDRPTVDQIIDNPIIQKSQTFIYCLLNGILSMTSSKIDKAIDYLRNLQKYCDIISLQQKQFDEAQEKFIFDLQEKFPSEVLQQRLKKPLKNSIHEIGRVFYQMNRVRTEFEHEENKWEAQYEKALGNNGKQYFINKYKCELNNQDSAIQQLSVLEKCTYNREVEDNGNIFVGLYKDGQRFYGRYYEHCEIQEGHLKDGMFQDEKCQYGIDSSDLNWYYDGNCINDIFNGYGVQIWNDGDMFCGEFKNAHRHGQGTFYWNDGEVYEGQWMNHKQHGKGVWKYVSGNTAKGTWKDGFQHGECVKIYASGKERKKMFDMGKKVKQKK
eukprot:403357574